MSVHNLNDIMIPGIIHNIMSFLDRNDYLNIYKVSTNITRTIRNENITPPYPEMMLLQPYQGYNAKGLCWSPNSQQLMCYIEGTIFQYTLQNGIARYTRWNHVENELPNFDIGQMKVSRDWSVIVIKMESGRILIFDNQVQPMQLIHHFHPVAINAIALAPNIRHFYSFGISQNGNILAQLDYNAISFYIGIKTNPQALTVHSFNHNLWRISTIVEFCPNEVTAVFYGCDSYFCWYVCKVTYDPATNSLIYKRYRLSYRKADYITTLSLSNDGTMVVIGSDCGRVDILNITNCVDGFHMNRFNVFNHDENALQQESLIFYSPPDSPRYAVSFSFNDEYIITGHVIPSRIRFYNMDDNRIKIFRTGYYGAVNLIQSSSDGRFLFFRNGESTFLTTLKEWIDPFLVS